jgi:hypothetical protein
VICPADRPLSERLEDEGNVKAVTKAVELDRIGFGRFPILESLRSSLPVRSQRVGDPELYLYLLAFVHPCSILGRRGADLKMRLIQVRSSVQAPKNVDECFPGNVFKEAKEFARW